MIKNIKVPASTISDVSLQKIKNFSLSKVLLLTRLIVLQLFNNIKLESKYFLNIIKKIFILVFFYSILFLNFLLNKEGSNNVLLKDCLLLELSDIWLLTVSGNLTLKPP
jgi:hypothetical protein